MHKISIKTEARNSEIKSAFIFDFLSFLFIVNPLSDLTENSSFDCHLIVSSEIMFFVIKANVYSVENERLQEAMIGRSY